MSDEQASPVLGPLPVEQWSETARTVLPRYLRRPQLYLSGGPDALPMPKALGVFAHHVHLGEAWMTFTDVLVGEHSTLDPRHRELAILRVAWQAGSEYEWKQHIRIALGAGLTTEDLYAVPEGPSAERWSDAERLLLQAVDQIVENARVDSATWSALAAHLDAAQLLELMFAIGGYLCFAAVTNTIGLAPDPPTEPVDAPEMPARAGR